MVDLIHEFKNLPTNPIVAIGGFLNLRKPYALINQLVKSDRKDLIILTLSGCFEIDYLLRKECVNELIAPYAGGESIMPVLPVYREKCLNNEIIAEPWDTALLMKSLEAGSQGIRDIEWNAVKGTDITGNNRRIKETDGQVFVDAIVPDISLIHGSYADKSGNVYFNGPAWGDILLAWASKKIIVSVEEIIDDIDAKEEMISNDLVDHLIVIPGGAKPFSSPGYYDLNENELRKLSAIP